MGEEEDVASLTEEERRALRGSKFAPLPSRQCRPQRQEQPRLAHPGGPMTTNKAAALAKFLERKLQQPDGLDSINPEILELAVRNAKEAVSAGGTSGGIVRHVSSFEDNEEYEMNDAKVACKQNSDKKKAKSKGLAAKAKFSKKKRKKKKKRDHLLSSDL